MIRISLPNQLRYRLRANLIKAGSREIGGVMMGEQIDTDYFRLVDFSLDATSGTSTHFERNPDHHRQALAQFFESTNSDYRRFNYLGEWHSHPSFSVRPSLKDILSMRRLVSEEADIDFSALLIVRLRSPKELEMSATMFVKNSPTRSVMLFSEKVSCCEKVLFRYPA